MAVTLVQGVTSASAGENSTAETKCYFYVDKHQLHPFCPSPPSFDDLYSLRLRKDMNSKVCDMWRWAGELVEKF